MNRYFKYKNFHIKFGFFNHWKQERIIVLLPTVVIGRADKETCISWLCWSLLFTKLPRPVHGILVKYPDSQPGVDF